MLPTPLEPALFLAPGRSVFLKREDVHELGAFKWRGALPTLAGLARDGTTAVVTASTGNHGAATAWAAQRVGMDAIVFLPAPASGTKVALLESLGADLRRVGADLDEAKDAARVFAAEHRLPFFEDGAEPAQYDGYGVIADEIVEQRGEPPEAVVVPVGNGALIGGIGRALRRAGHTTRVVGVAARNAPVMADSWRQGQPVPADRAATIADGLAVRVAIPSAVETMVAVVDEMLLVSERQIAEAMAAYHRAGIRAEPAAAAALAALPQVDGDPVVLVVTGRNVDDALLRRAIQDPASFAG